MKTVTLYHDAKDVGGTLHDGTKFQAKDGVLENVAEAHAAHLCESFGFRTTPEKPKSAPSLTQTNSELDALRATINAQQAQIDKLLAAGAKK